MPKRVGFLCEKVLTEANCIEAVKIGTKNLKRTHKIRRIRENADDVGRKILQTLENGWVPDEPRERVINEGSAMKTRHLRIPSTRDHLIHTAIMLPLIPLIEKRLDFYCAGSVPGRGQKRIHHCIKGWMGRKNPPKYAGETDVRHAYETTTKETVMRSLRRIVKDKRYLMWMEQILDQMGGSLAIGFTPSHWLFNLVMADVDRAVRTKGKGVLYCRFMDNIWIADGRKRRLHRAMRLIDEECGKLGLNLNRSTQVFPTKQRAIQALSYRYFRGNTLLKKATMYRITRGVRRAGNNTNAHHCRAAMSLIGITRHCNSYNYRKDHVYCVVSIKRMKGVISIADKKRNLRGAAKQGDRSKNSHNCTGASQLSA